MALSTEYLPKLIIPSVDSAAITTAYTAPIRKKTKRKMSSLQIFWDKINSDYPELIDMIVGYDEKEVLLKGDRNMILEGDNNCLSPIFSWPTLLPIAKSSVAFNSKEDSYDIKITLL